MTPIVKHARNLYPDAHIAISTLYPQVFEQNPYFNELVNPHAPVQGYDKVIDLDGCYEASPSMHAIDAYSIKAFNSTNYDKSTELFLKLSDRVHVYNEASSLNLFRCVVIHPSVSWPSRTLPRETWLEVIDKLISKGLSVIIVGTNNDLDLGPTRHHVYNLKNMFSIHQVSYLISKALCFIGTDSSMVHVAGTTKTPIVGIFTCVKAEYRLPYRNGQYDSLCATVKPDIDCYGCLEKHISATNLACDRGDNACVKMIKSDNILKALDSVIGT